jgi:hypothetical protein
MGTILNTAARAVKRPECTMIRGGVGLLRRRPKDAGRDALELSV